MTGEMAGERPEIERHWPKRDDVQIVGLACGECGEPVDCDGDSCWHKDPDLEPVE